MQLIIDEIVNNIRAIERSASSLSPEVMRQLVSACVNAVREVMAKEARVKEEQSIKGPWATQSHEER